VALKRAADYTEGHRAPQPRIRRHVPHPCHV